MKKECFLPALFVLFAACSSPLLEWIESETGSGSLYVAAASDKAIINFSFGISGETLTIRERSSAKSGKIPITVVLPAGSATNNLTPAIEYIGKSVSPGSGISQNFNSPVTYTVTAEDGSTLDYEVEVIVKTAQSAEIIWFDLELPGGGSLMAEGDVIEGSGGQPGEIILRVPSGTNPGSLTAKIVQTGGTLSGPGVSGGDTRTAITLNSNFSGPVTYKVTPESGPPKDYTVTVFVDKSTVKEIKALSFTDPDNNDVTGKVIIGVEPQPNGKYAIMATVSADPDDLKPIITYKGAAIAGLGIGDTDSDTNNTLLVERTTEAASSGKDFSDAVTYTVTAEDGTSRDYEVTVYKNNLNSGKAITGFYFPAVQGILGSVGIINETAKTIAVTVPAGTNLSSLTPVIYHTGDSISPISGAPQDFRNPIIYTVKARDKSTQPYTVSVFVAKRSDKAITAFGFANVGGETTIIGSGPASDGTIPISVTVPYYSSYDTGSGLGVVTDLSKLTPELTLTGVSVTGPGVSGNGPGAVTGSPNTNFTGPADYTVTAEDGTTQKYCVTVVRAANPVPLAVSDDASIDGFYFTSPPAAGVINQNTGAITITVPYDTVLTNLVPAIYFTGNIVVEGSAADTGTAPTSSVIGGETVYKPAMSSPAGIPADFTGTVDYTVTALDQIHFKTYTVTVNIAPAPPLSSVREISFFSFLWTNDGDIITAISPVQDALGNYPVEVIVPEITDLADLTPVILYKGESISGPGGFTSSDPHPTDPEMKGTVADSSVDFFLANPRLYTVTAANGQSSRYNVTVRKDDNNEKEITTFYFESPVAVGSVDQAAQTITVPVPNGTNLAALSPTVSYTGVSLDPASGRAVNFSSPVIYNVTARNGTVRPYTVRVIPKPASTKEITEFSLPGAGVLETVIGSIPDPDGLIPISITVSGQSNVGALRPTITHTGVSITPPGGTPQTGKPFVDGARNFSVPQAYRVTAEDGSFKDYAVSIHASGDGAKIITGFVFKSVPLDPPGSGTVSVVGQIDQDSHTIEVKVPHTADITSLAPTVTYLGKSLRFDADSGVPIFAGSVGQSNTFLDDARNFDSPHYYTVADTDVEDPQPDNIQKYTVTVKKIPEVTISYESPKDDKFITESFGQGNGWLTVTIDSSDPFPSDPSPGGSTYYYGGPYKWYLDGTPYPVSGTPNTLILKTADFEAGRHELVVMAKRSSDNMYYTNKLYFQVQE
jgi:hypothetical protein